MDLENFEVKVVEVINDEDGSALVVLGMNSKAAHAFVSLVMPDMDSKAARAFLGLGVLHAIKLGLDAVEEG